jgi:hypothetical protein
MIIELLASQVPAYWPQIRMAGIKSDGITENLQATYANELLVDLLCGKKTCVLSVDDQRQTKLLVIMSVMYNALLQKKMIQVHNAFGLQKHAEQDRFVLLEDFKELCKKYDCVGIVTNASHEYIKLALEQTGFKATNTVMSYYL